MKYAPYLNAMRCRPAVPHPLIFKTLITPIVMLYLIFSLVGQVRAEIYDTEAWGNKFRYGAFSTLLSSYVMGTHFRHLMSALDNEEDQNYGNIQYIEGQIKAFQKQYMDLSDEDIEKILDFARNDLSNSVFEEERSVVRTIEQNKAFIKGMKENQDLMPIDFLVQNGEFVSNSFQFNTHRTLYSEAFGIPQNSLSGIVNAYVAGIRNIEFDVLDTSEYVSVLIHDLITNRQEGNYFDFGNFVEDMNFDTVRRAANNILIPILEQPNVVNTDLKIIETERVLSIVNQLMPQMTLYLDARNDASLSIIRLLATNPKYRNNVVLKIYPFTLSGGRHDLVNRYAKRYFAGNIEEATREIFEAKPHVLLAIGHAEMEANQDATIGGVINFGWEEFKEASTNLPFALNSSNLKNQFDGKDIFTEDQLKEIEMRTFLLFHWAMGLTGITETLVFQLSGIVSLVKVIDGQNKAEFVEMDKKKTERYVLSAAIHDNFLVLYNMLKQDQMNLNIFANEENEVKLVPLASRIKNTKFGLSDRFPDFALAHRTTSDLDEVDTTTLKNFNYSMLGTAYVNEGYQQEKVRSANAIMARIREVESITATPVVFATTDLPTDLRLGFMGLYGQFGLPTDVLYRSGGIIKEGLSIEPSTFSIPEWLKTLNSARMSDEHSTFKADSASLSQKQKELTQAKRILYSLQQTHSNGVPLTDTDAWKLLGVTELTMKSALDSRDLENAITTQTQKVSELEEEFLIEKDSFGSNHNVEFITDRYIKNK